MGHGGFYRLAMHGHVSVFASRDQKSWETARIRVNILLKTPKLVHIKNSLFPLLTTPCVLLKWLASCQLFAVPARKLRTFWWWEWKAIIQLWDNSPGVSRGHLPMRLQETTAQDRDNCPGSEQLTRMSRTRQWTAAQAVNSCPGWVPPITSRHKWC